MAITLRNVKGSALTHTELDANFTDITSSMVHSGSISGTTLTLHKSGSTLDLDLSGLGGGGTGLYTNETPTPVDFPNADDPSIPAGSTFIEKTFEEMMNMMLYPTLNPTLTNPSNTFTLSVTGFQEIGKVISSITTTAGFNRGSISPDYGTSGFRSGPPNTYVYTGTGLSNHPNTSLTDDPQTISDYTVVQGPQSWTGAVSYDDGEQPLDSDGEAFSTPLLADTTSAITRTITGVYPVYATTSNITTLTKQSLQSMSADIIVSVVAEDSSGNKHTIEIPDAFGQIQDVKLFNTVSNTFDPYGLGNFNIDDTITKDVNAVATGVGYKRFTHNGSKVGVRTYKFIV